MTPNKCPGGGINTEYYIICIPEITQPPATAGKEYIQFPQLYAHTSAPGNSIQTVEFFVPTPNIYKSLIKPFH